MTNRDLEATKPPYKPTAEQLERAAALDRQNQIYVYMPLVLLALGVLITFVALLGLTLFGGEAEASAWRGYVSGIADMIIILTALPLMLVCAIIPISAIAIVAASRQNEWKPINSLRTLLWRLEGALGRVQQRVDQTAPAAADYTIKGNGWFSYISTVLRKIQILLFGRSDRPE